MADESKKIGRKNYENIIKEAWDIDVEDVQYVKLKVRCGKEDTKNVRNELQQYNMSYQKDGDDYIYQGNIRGMSDFRVWIREHFTTCIVLEPEKLRKEFKKALLVKNKRYKEVNTDEK